ncbi:hypothetical protein VTL71DRAFT_14187 [Oculimacula yallundae]|uniref:Uncharacterized protein n=1 Tax=Oculimacula yallundae TaxID=86028 RepID=A0ABR4CHW2_9HELO
MTIKPGLKVVQSRPDLTHRIGPLQTIHGQYDILCEQRTLLETQLTSRYSTSISLLQSRVLIRLSTQAPQRTS